MMRFNIELIKTVWYRQRDRHIYQWNKTENLEIDLHRYSQLIFYKGAKAIQRKNSLFNK